MKLKYSSEQKIEGRGKKRRNLFDFMLIAKLDIVISHYSV